MNALLSQLDVRISSLEISNLNASGREGLSPTAAMYPLLLADSRLSCTTKALLLEGNVDCLPVHRGRRANILRLVVSNCGNIMGSICPWCPTPTLR
jgi:hypothetical protein